MMFASASVTNRGFSFVYREDGKRRIPIARTRWGRLVEVIRLSSSAAVSGIITALFGGKNGL